MFPKAEFRKYVKPFVDDIARYGTLSIKSGASSNPACRDISGDLLDMHAGWKCDVPTQRTDTLSTLLMIG